MGHLRIISKFLNSLKSKQLPKVYKLERKLSFLQELKNS